jgi:hypothetical protein
MNKSACYTWAHGRMDAWTRGRIVLTLQPLQDAVDGAGAAAAGHGDVELVGVVGHYGGVVL